MIQRILIADSVRYLVFADIYQKFSDPKQKRKAFALMGATLSGIDKRGFEHITLKQVARESGVSPALLRYYFGDLEQLKEVSLKYSRLLAQKIVLEFIGDEKDPRRVFEKYITGHFIWLKSFKTHVRVWLAFLSACPTRPTQRSLNSQALAAARARVAQLIREAQIEGRTSPEARAVLVQTLLLGALVNAVTEDDYDIDSMADMIVSESKRIAGFS